MNSATLINQDSGKVEFDTPAYIVDAARAVMGGIDLDPASCSVANRTVKAADYFTKNDNGLSREWFGRVWMNHPFEKYKNHLWINKLVAEFRAGRIHQALCICYNSASEGWFRPLLEFPQCFLHKRVNYLDFTGEIKQGVTKGSVVTCLGSHISAFHREFSKLGTVKLPYEPK